METVPASSRTLQGRCRLLRIGRFGFPVEKLAGDEETIALLGRDGSMRIFFGPGRRVVPAGGPEWRIKAATSGRHIVPIIRSGSRIIATSGPLHARRSYGINGDGYALTVIPVGKTGFRSPGRWVLRRHEDQIATIDEHRRVIIADESVPVAATVLAFTLITHGIPGEGDLMPGRD